MKALATNKRAKFDYEILENFEAGLVLLGHEVKSIKLGNVSLKGSFITIRNRELWLKNTHISRYKPAGKLPDHDVERERKLLVRKSELRKLIGKTGQQGLTLVPIRLYTKGNKVKLKFGLARGKKKHEKRDLIKKRDIDREIQQRLKQG